MAGAELLALRHHLDAERRHRRLDLVAARADHHHAALGRQFLDAGEQVEQHRPAGERVQHLVLVRLHPRALAGGEDDGGKRAARR